MKQKYMSQNHIKVGSQLTETKATPNSSSNTSLNNVNLNFPQLIPNISLSLFQQKQFPNLFQSKENINLSVNPSIKSNSLTVSYTPKNIHTSIERFNKKHHKFLLNTTHLDFKKNNDSVPKINKKQQKIISDKYKSDKKCQQSQLNIQNIKVFVRVKPNQNINQCLYHINQTTLRVQDRLYAFDQIFPGCQGQQQIFNKVAMPLIDNMFKGYNGTIFAYGQTGSGKTYTMFGQKQQYSKGIIPRTIVEVFSKVTQNKQVKYTIGCSMLEIYKQNLIDMLQPTKNQLKLKQSKNGVIVQGLSIRKNQNRQDFLAIVDETYKNRKIASTKINQKSSRSHTILTIYVTSDNYQCKICLIDLAGSQKVNKAGVKGDNLQQTKKINYSLSCLGNVINALTTRKKSNHIPFRDSKLTRILKDSLSGKFQTSIIVNCSSNLQTQQQTVSSLKFAERAKKIKVSPKIYDKKNNNSQSIEYLQSVIKKLTNDLNQTKKQLTKYKALCDKIQTHEKQIQPSARQIPSERAYVAENMKTYQREMNKTKKIESSVFQNISSLNISKSIGMSGIQTPSVSSLSNRQSYPDFSLSFSICKQQDYNSQFLKIK